MHIAIATAFIKLSRDYDNTLKKLHPLTFRVEDMVHITNIYVNAMLKAEQMAASIEKEKNETATRVLVAYKHLIPNCHLLSEYLKAKKCEMKTKT